jgi:hypothetical protein
MAEFPHTPHNLQERTKMMLKFEVSDAVAQCCAPAETTGREELNGMFSDNESFIKRLFRAQKMDPSQ